MQMIKSQYESLIRAGKKPRKKKNAKKKKAEKPGKQKRRQDG